MDRAGIDANTAFRAGLYLEIRVMIIMNGRLYPVTPEEDQQNLCRNVHEPGIRHADKESAQRKGISPPGRI
jgi:hypothetical protein